eukprot:1336593-Amorphochlora_amoeboformis.AAC.1
MQTPILRRKYFPCRAELDVQKSEKWLDVYENVNILDGSTAMGTLEDFEAEWRCGDASWA